MNQKGFANIALIVLIIVIVGVTGYFVFNFQKSTMQQIQTDRASDSASKSGVDLQTNKETGVPSENERKRIDDFDQRRINYVQQIKHALEAYFGFFGEYPSSISELKTKKIIGELPTDPLTGKSFIYAPGRSPSAQSGKYDTFHLGANLENKDNSRLLSDQDCNSITASKCGVEGLLRPQDESFSTAGEIAKIRYESGFDGSDTKGCRDEPDLYCYDVTP